jgi:hypothetical protein
MTHWPHRRRMGWLARPLPMRPGVHTEVHTKVRFRSTKPQRQSLAQTTRGEAQVVRRGFRTRLCQCGHNRDAHRHYRTGSDCALCGCPRWSSRRMVCQLIRQLARARS